MKLLKKGYVLKQADLKSNVRRIKVFDLKKGNQPQYILEIKEKKYLVRRTGECDYKKCKNACCKIISIHVSGKYSDGEPINRYIKNFATKIIGDHAIIEKKCSQLNKNGLCNVWKKKKFPGPCDEFPHPNDGVYIAVEPVCSFKFVVDEVIQ